MAARRPETLLPVDVVAEGHLAGVVSEEDRALIPSPKVATYDLMPEMSAFGITEELVKRIKSELYDFVVANYANGDMVGHSGKLDATIKAVETVDKCVGEVVPPVGFAAVRQSQLVGAVDR